MMFNNKEIYVICALWAHPLNLRILILMRMVRDRTNIRIVKVNKVQERLKKYKISGLEPENTMIIRWDVMKEVSVDPQSITQNMQYIMD